MRLLVVALGAWERTSQVEARVPELLRDSLAPYCQSFTIRTPHPDFIPFWFPDHRADVGNLGLAGELWEASNWSKSLVVDRVLGLWTAKGTTGYEAAVNVSMQRIDLRIDRKINRVETDCRGSTQNLLTLPAGIGAVP